MNNTLISNTISEVKIRNFFESVHELLEPICTTHFNSRCLLGATNTVEVIEFICLCMEEPPLTKEETMRCLNEIREFFPVINNNLDSRGH